MLLDCLVFTADDRLSMLVSPFSQVARSSCGNRLLAQVNDCNRRFNLRRMGLSWLPGVCAPMRRENISKSESGKAFWAAGSRAGKPIVWDLRSGSQLLRVWGAIDSLIEWTQKQLAPLLTRRGQRRTIRRRYICERTSALFCDGNRNTLRYPQYMDQLAFSLFSTLRLKDDLSSKRRPRLSVAM